MGTITRETAETKEQISALIFANKLSDFREFTTLVEEMLDKYAADWKQVPITQPPADMSLVPNSIFDGLVEVVGVMAGLLALKRGKKMSDQEQMLFDKTRDILDRLKRFKEPIQA